jgi:N,N'-diacetyllegionaminate synthase
VIEKHFSLSVDMEGPDHRASLSPEQLVEMVAAIRNIELALGNGEKACSASELANRDVARKSIVALVAVAKGELFTEKNITTKRPGTGVCAMLWDDVLGTKAVRDFYQDELVNM